MELVLSVLIAFAVGVYAGVLVMAMMFVSHAEDEASSRRMPMGD